MAMDAVPEPIHNPFDQPEHRRHVRIYKPFPVTITNIDASGEAFEIHTVLNNFSAGGFYVRLERRIERGAKVFAIVRLSTSLPEVPTLRVAVRGIVLV